MGIQWLLLGVCILCGVSQLNCQLPEEQETPQIGESTENLGGTLFGFKPCLDESCSGLEANSQSGDDYGLHSKGAEIAEGVQSEEEYEPQEYFGYIPKEHPNAHCASLHPSAVEALEILESRHPEIAAIKEKVLEDLIIFASSVSSFHSENCSATVKLLDLVAFSAEELKKKYMEVTHDDCKYSSVPEGEYEEITDTTVRVTRRSDYATPEYWKPPYPQVTTPKPHPIEKTTDEPCSEKPPTVKPVKPCPEESGEEIEIIAEEYDEHSPPIVGSVRGIPGIHYPNYSDVPITSFSCADKYIPGFYADLETGCQVFHVCYEHRRESFLCPIGTTFNQPILACDYWYSSNCSLAPIYYEVNAEKEITKEEGVIVDDFISVVIDAKTDETQEHVIEDIAKFLPVKAKIVEFPESPKVATKEQNVEDVASVIFENIVSTATDVTSKTKYVVGNVPEPIYEPVPIFKAKSFSVKAPLAAANGAVVPAVVAKAKLAAAIPVAKVAVAKSVLPVVAKAKIASAALPVVATKVKVAAAVPLVAKVKVAGAALPVVAIKAKVAAAVPIVAKAKVAGAALPIVATKTKVAAAVPIVAKAKVAGAALPIVAGKTVAAVAVPVVAKAKVAVVAPAIGKVKVAAAAVPIAAKVKIAATVPKVAAKATIPALKSKLIASALPLAKMKLAAPALKGKALKVAGVPIVKAKVLAVPLVKSTLAGSAPLLKAKLVKAAAISPLTKKALALGYMKLLKTKKLALMG